MVFLMVALSGTAPDVSTTLALLEEPPRPATTAPAATGETLPDAVGARIPTYLIPPLPFELLAVAPATGDVLLMDLAAGFVTAYDHRQSQLPRLAGDGVLPYGSGWVVVAPDRAVSWYDDGVARESSPIVAPDREAESTVRYVVPTDRPDGALWVVDSSPGLEPNGSAGEVRLVAPSGDELASVSVPADVTPVAADGRGLLLNQHGRISIGGRFAWDPSSEMLIVRPDGSLEPLGSGIGLGFAAGSLVWLDCSAGPEECRVVSSPRDESEAEIGRAGAVAVSDHGSGYAAIYQPGVSSVSPDGRLLAVADVTADASGEPRLVVLDLDSPAVRALGAMPRPPASIGPTVMWSRDGAWLLTVGERPVAIEVATGERVDLWEWLPTNMFIYAVAAR